MDETSQQKSKLGLGSSRTKPKKRDRSASEERLLKAAEDVFSKYGFKGATTRMIADKAKVNESLIGRYFDGKMGLFFSLIEKHIEEHSFHKLDYPPQATFRDELSMFINSRLTEHCNKNEEFFKIVLSQCLVDKKFLRRIREANPMGIPEEFSERMLNFQKAGKIRNDVDITTLLESFDTYFHGVMFFDGVLNDMPEEKLKEKLDFFLNCCVSFLEKKT